MKIVLLINSDIGGVFAEKTSKLADISLLVYEKAPKHGMIKNYKIKKYEHRCDSDFEFLSKYDFDCIISFNWNHKIPDKVIRMYDCYNFHNSLLPKHRGPFPLLFAMLEKDYNIGVTMHKISSKYDSGDIYWQSPLAITPYTSFEIIILRCLQKSIAILGKFIEEYPNINLYQQNDKISSYDNLNKLDKYLITDKTTLNNFIHIAWAFDGKIPLKYVSKKDEIIVFYEYSLNKTPFFNKELKLFDDYIYISIPSKEF